MRCLLFLTLVLSAGCAHTSTPARPSQALSVLTQSAIQSRDPKRQKKYFLIAGSAQASSFAREIVEQKQILLSLGAKPSEIACFYSMPNNQVFSDEQKSYQELAPSLKDCYPATPKNVWQVMRDGNTARDFVYLYATAHGPPPEEIGQHSLWFETDSEDAFFTPRNLKQALRETTLSTTKKFLVIQGCYSGGFAHTEDRKYASDTLEDLPNTVVLTAARADRTSFGCDPGAKRTVFGGNYNDQLKSFRKLPPQIDWETLHRRMTTQVEIEEEFLRRNITAPLLLVPPSEPVLMRTQPKLAE